MTRRFAILFFLPILLLALFCLLCLRTCTNSPWDSGLPSQNALFLSYSAQIKTLDPYSANFQHEAAVIDNIVEAPLAYHYLKRPYTLIPRLLQELPHPEYYGKDGRRLPEDASEEEIGRICYTLKLREDVHYQPHPCFAENPQPAIRHPRRPQDWLPCATRPLHAADFKAAFVRLCDKRSPSTVYSTFRSFLLGMEECTRQLEREVAKLDEIRRNQGESEADLAKSPSLPDYRDIPLEGCQVLDAHTLRITLTRKYPQFLYWMAMHYTAPLPVEAMRFYQRPDARQAELSYGLWPVGTGPFLLEEADPNSRIVLARNPNFHDWRYPTEGSQDDQASGLLSDAGKRLPFLERVYLQYEREGIPNWLKFRQGYYDLSPRIPDDMFDSAVAIAPGGNGLHLTEEMAAQGIHLHRSTPPISYYFAFNLLDPVVGGLSPEKCALRQALSLVLDMREYGAIFRNGNAIPAEGILPPGIFGALPLPDGLNHVLNEWDPRTKQSIRKPLEEARRLLELAGYPGGVSRETGEVLRIHLDHAAAGLPDFKNRFQWMAARFRLLGVELVERPSDLNRNREKLDTGKWQFLFERGWVADYPDPENFLFLFHSANGRVQSHGQGPNYCNYASAEFDSLFRRLEAMPNSPERLALIQQALDRLAKDAPMVWGFHPMNAPLAHAWLQNFKPTEIAYDNLAYLRVDAVRRARLQQAWNRPPRTLFLFAFLTLALLWTGTAAAFLKR